MPGPWSRANPPKRPGAYTNFVARRRTITPASDGATVGMVITHDWGPIDVVTGVNSFGEFVSIFGDSDTPGARAVEMCFRGEGLPGFGGAGRIEVLRKGATGAAAASRVLQNTTPATAVTLTARYKGDRGEKLGVVVQTNAFDAAKKDLIIYLGTVEVERYLVPAVGAGYLAGVVAAINANSDWVTATVGTDGVALTNVGTPASPSAFTGGDDGATLTNTDWTNAFDALDPVRFSIFAAYDLTDSTVLTALKTKNALWNSRGKRVQCVVGGGSGDTLSTALTRSASLNDPQFVNLGVGTYRDANYGVLTTAQLAPRLAGILASRGDQKDLTHARLVGLSIETGAPTDSDILSAIDGGLMVIGRDSHDLSPLRFELGLTTYTTTSNADRPFDIWSNPKFVKAMGDFEMALTRMVEMEVTTPSLPVNDDTREFVIGRANELMEERVPLVFSADYDVRIDTDPVPSDTDEFIGVVYDATFARTTKQVRNTVIVG